MNLNCELIYNSLSFGNVSLGITYELYKRGIAPNIFPISGQVDLSAFDRLDDDFKLYLQSCFNKAPKNFKKTLPSFRLWHINGSWSKISEPSALLTFFELDSLTEAEVNIINSYNKVFVTNTYHKKVFEECGVQCPVIFIPLGFDSIHTKKFNKAYYTDGSITFSLFGKMENCRKRTGKVIKSWIKRFGCKPVGEKVKYRLHLHVNNPFFTPEEMNKAFGDVFDNQPPPINVQIYPLVKTQTELVDAYNATNVIIDMGNEALSLPSLNAAGIGKHMIAHNCMALADWAPKAGATMVNSNSKIIAEDGRFFIKGHPFNQGNVYDFDENEFISACEEAIKKVELNSFNEQGLYLQKEYSFEKGVDIILENLEV